MERGNEEARERGEKNGMKKGKDEVGHGKGAKGANVERVGHTNKRKK